MTARKCPYGSGLDVVGRGPAHANGRFRHGLDLTAVTQHRGTSADSGGVGVATTAVKVIAEAADTVRRPAAGLVVLLYHRVRSGTGVPATLFAATDHVEAGRWFPDGGRPTSWSALSDALTTGLVVVGSHTHTHSWLDRLDPSRVTDELDHFALPTFSSLW